MAVLGSVFTSLYAARLTDTSFAGLPNRPCPPASSRWPQPWAAPRPSPQRVSPGSSPMCRTPSCTASTSPASWPPPSASSARSEPGWPCPAEPRSAPPRHHPADVDRADKAGRPDPGAVGHPLLQRRRPGPPHRPRRRHRHRAVPAAGGVHEDALPTPRLAAEPRRRRHRRRAHHHRHPAPARQVRPVPARRRPAPARRRPRRPAPRRRRPHSLTTPAWAAATFRDGEDAHPVRQYGGRRLWDDFEQTLTWWHQAPTRRPPPRCATTRCSSRPPLTGRCGRPRSSCAPSCRR